MEEDNELIGLEKIIKETIYPNQKDNSIVKGDIFEDYTQSFLLGNRYHSIRTPTQEEIRRYGMPPIWGKVDFITTNMLSKNQYGIQCKYRRIPWLDLTKENNKFREYTLDNNPLLFYIIGFGGFSYEPRYTYLVNAGKLLNNKKRINGWQINEYRINGREDITKVLK